MDQYQENRFSKIDDAIQRLAAVSADLSKMLAVQEQRLTQQERNTDKINFMMDKRKEELDSSMKEVYDEIKETQENLHQEIKKSREQSSEYHTRLDIRISRIERLVVLGTGALLCIGGIIGIAELYLKFIS